MIEALSAGEAADAALAPALTGGAVAHLGRRRADQVAVARATSRFQVAVAILPHDQFSFHSIQLTSIQFNRSIQFNCSIQFNSFVSNQSNPIQFSSIVSNQSKN